MVYNFSKRQPWAPTPFISAIGREIRFSVGRKWPLLWREAYQQIPRESGVSSTMRLLGFIVNASGILDRPVKPGNDKWVHLRDPATQSARAMHETFRPKQEGAGKAGCPLHPQPRMRNEKAYEHSHHRFTGKTRPSLRNGFNGFLRALPGDRAFLPPSPAEDSSASLTPASGRQDHTTSPSARLALSSEAQPASTASHPPRS